ncbi:MAG: hypothetical protein Q9162_003355 [Coniocarpon cinnabarinum]
MSPPNRPFLGKRKEPSFMPSNSRQHKRSKIQDARAIASQTTGKAFGNGELDVERFVQARAFEIKALEKSIKKSRSALSTRAFQSVPRELRRRTASHNVKRVPQRLRARASKEMREDNTPTVNSRTRQAKTSGKDRLRLEIAGRKHREAERTRLRKARKREAREGGLGVERVRQSQLNKLQSAPVSKAKFRKRQRFKAWLPTHLFHAKRAHMPPATSPLWRMAIPLCPTQKCFRPTHRAANARGAMAWDTSYMSTIGVSGTQRSIVGLLKGLGVGNGTSDSWWTGKATRWLAGSRTLEAWVYERDRQPKRAIAPVSILWQVSEQDSLDHIGSAELEGIRRRLFIRVHPSAFFELWDELLRLAKIQKPACVVEDLRFEVGSVQIVGPAAAEALVGTLWPVLDTGSRRASSEQPAEIWSRLRHLTTPTQLPQGATMGFDIIDPRLHHPPRTVNKQLSTHAQQELLTLLASWPVDVTQPAQRLFDRRARVLADRQLPSQKSINRRKGSAPPGEHPASVPSDPCIPIVVAAQGRTKGSQDTWTVLMPWKCVSPVWYCLMFYPLSSGGTMRFGGLEQSQQLALETGTPWFPGDFPGTQAGKAWEDVQRRKRKADWEKLPKGRRVEYDGVELGHGRKGELGDGWACDWGYLLATKDESADTQEGWRQVHPLEAANHLQSKTANETGITHGLCAVKITMMGKGVPTTCARVYRLPTTDTRLRQAWLEKIRGSGDQDEARAQRAASQKPGEAGFVHQGRQRLAALLLDKQSAHAQTQSGLLHAPEEEDLIGFMTSGNLNLTEGKGTGIANIALDLVRRSSAARQLSPEELVEHQRHSGFQDEVIAGHGQFRTLWAHNTLSTSNEGKRGRRELISGRSHAKHLRVRRAFLRERRRSVDLQLLR